MTEFTPDRLAELREVAAGATEGTWRATEPREWGDDDTMQSAVMVSEGKALTWDDHGGEVFHPADATFIATFDPPTVTALIAALEAKTAEVEVEQAQNDDLADEIMKLRRAVHIAERERDEARAEAQVEALRDAADDWHEEHVGTRPGPHNWLWDRADRIAREAGIKTGESNE